LRFILKFDSGYRNLLRHIQIEFLSEVAFRFWKNISRFHQNHSGNTRPFARLVSSSLSVPASSYVLSEATAICTRMGESKQSFVVDADLAKSNLAESLFLAIAHTTELTELELRFLSFPAILNFFFFCR
jgi:hypothetical protein